MYYIFSDFGASSAICQRTLITIPIGGATVKTIQAIVATVCITVIIAACTVVYSPLKIIALTFDDGPTLGYTGKVLNILKEKGVKATFFVLGKNAVKYPNLVRREADEGHVIGNHSYSHRSFAEENDQQVFKEILGTQQIVQQLTGHSPLFVRNPHGIESAGAKKAIRALGLTGTVGWHWGKDVRDDDWRCNGVQDTLNFAKSATAPGAILLAHDGNEVTQCPNQLDWLSQYIDWALSHGYQFGLLRASSGPNKINMNSWVDVVPVSKARYWNG